MSLLFFLVSFPLSFPVLFPPLKIDGRDGKGVYGPECHTIKRFISVHEAEEKRLRRREKREGEGDDTETRRGNRNKDPRVFRLIITYPEAVPAP